MPCLAWHLKGSDYYKELPFQISSNLTVMSSRHFAEREPALYDGHLGQVKHQVGKLRPDLISKAGCEPSVKSKPVQSGLSGAVQ